MWLGKEADLGDQEGRAREVLPPHAVRHYTVKELAKIWNLSDETVVKLFESEPGVIVISERRKGSISRRRYRTLRIPEFVVERVHRRLSVR
jgi:predicted methyltransferase MtxX (methanogen marker protein 4)